MKSQRWIYLLLLSFVTASVSCKKNGKTAPVISVQGQSMAKRTANQESLLQYVPASAKAALVLRQNTLKPLLALALTKPKARAEVSEYLSRAVGVDLTKAHGVVAYATQLVPTPLVVGFIRLDKPGAVKGEPAGEHRGVKLVKLKHGLVAATLPDGLVLGLGEAAKVAIDLHKKQVPPINKDSDLADLLAFAGKEVDVLAGASASLAAGSDMPLPIQSFGIRAATLAFDKDQRLTVALSGEKDGLAKVKQLAMTQAKKMRDQVEAEKNELVKQDDQVFEAVAAIVGVHMWDDMIKEIEPRMKDGRLVSSYKVPSSQMSGILVPTIGVLAAVAIPAFVKYVRKAKTVEAAESLDKIKIGAREFFVVDHWNSEGNLEAKRFPRSTGWVPASPCCKQPGGKCRTPASVWDNAGFDALKFGLTEPHYYQYRFISSGITNNAQYTAVARGDLDCDGIYSTFEIRGRVDSEGSVVTVGPIITNEIE